jgi:hypothetical protein
MDHELMGPLRRIRPTILLLGAALLICPALQAQRHSHDKPVVLILNAREENKSCLYPVDLGSNGLPTSPSASSRCPYQEGDNRDLFLRQWDRTEMRVFNRKFLATYTITIDNVTSIPTIPAIRNLNEASNLSLGGATLIGPPTAKGGTEGLSQRTTASILFELLDAGQSAKPKADLDSDKVVLDRERDRIRAELLAFTESYNLLRGRENAETVKDSDCKEMTGAPDATTLRDCLRKELASDSAGPDWAGTAFRNEDAFRRIVLQAQDLILAVNAFGAELAKSDLVTKEQKIEGDVAQYENDVVTYHANIQAASDAARLAEQLGGSAFQRTLNREQMKVFLAQALKATQASAASNSGATPSPQDEADLNHLLDLYVDSIRKTNSKLLGERLGDLRCSDGEDPNCRERIATASFEQDLARVREDVNVRLVGAIDGVNKAQSELLNRVNYIYDNSEVPDALVKDIDISKYSGNLIVYYTIRRIETFTRFTVAAAGALGSSDQPGAAAPPNPNTVLATPTAAPPASAAPASGGASPASGNGGPPPPPPGIVVSSGSFEVHTLYSFNVTAAFAFTSLRDQSISKQPMPQSCTGTSATPDANCFAPVLNGTPHQFQVFIALDYYIHKRDTFPRDKFPNQIKRRWICATDFWQCVGPMGGLSVYTLNDYFLGAFFEPVIGVQFSGGANFGSETMLQKGYSLGTPVDITGDFPTYQKRHTGLFISAGLDFALFSKIFGKVTGVGTSTSSSTQGN